jgi:diphthine-ammonia ligase
MWINHAGSSDKSMYAFLSVSQVGHQLIAAYATCMGLPLFRRRIRGKSKSQGLQYSATEGDEVEDLQALLATVTERLPDVRAVSSGAIASDYQRLRVENVRAFSLLVCLGAS